MVGVAVTAAGAAGPSAWAIAASAEQINRKAKVEALRIRVFRDTVRILAVVGSLQPKRRSSFGTVPHGWQT